MNKERKSCPCSLDSLEEVLASVGEDLRKHGVVRFPLIHTHLSLPLSGNWGEATQVLSSTCEELQIKMGFSSTPLLGWVAPNTDLRGEELEEANYQVWTFANNRGETFTDRFNPMVILDRNVSGLAVPKQISLGGFGGIKWHFSLDPEESAIPPAIAEAASRTQNKVVCAHMRSDFLLDPAAVENLDALAREYLSVVFVLNHAANITELPEERFPEGLENLRSLLCHYNIWIETSGVLKAETLFRLFEIFERASGRMNINPQIVVGFDIPACFGHGWFNGEGFHLAPEMLEIAKKEGRDGDLARHIMRNAPHRLLTMPAVTFKEASQLAKSCFSIPSMLVSQLTAIIKAINRCEERFGVSTADDLARRIFNRNYFFPFDIWHLPNLTCDKM